MYILRCLGGSKQSYMRALRPLNDVHHFSILGVINFPFFFVSFNEDFSDISITASSEGP